ncbi:MAG: efflux RND transporter periplasmic adaptor subunit [Thermodesulfobacteriota bacterium]
MNTESHPEIATILASHSITGKKGRRVRWIVSSLMILAVAAMLLKWIGSEKREEWNYRTQPVERGNLTITVTATGNLQPTNQVTVGSELSGIIKTVEVDYNDQVKIGQVLATLDTSKLQAQVLQAGAALESAQAMVLQAEATIRETRSALSRLREARILSNNRAVSINDLEAAQASLDRSLAEKAGADAAVHQAQATLEAYETDLYKAAIRSPVNGIVLTRTVEPGQTVAASLQAPILFTLAEDLTQMVLHVDVDEADVSQVKEGQEATFTVDAYPHRSFPATITQVRFGSKNLNGVVTYETLLNVDNSDLSLRPGMTATADIIVRKLEDALLVSNAALRFIPPEKQKETGSSGKGLVGAIFRRPGGNQVKQPDEKTADKQQQHVWALRDGRLQAIPVKVGVTDGTRTEVLDGELQVGTQLVVDTTARKS